jgi:hypothetical protein
MLDKPGTEVGAFFTISPFPVAAAAVLLFAMAFLIN